MPRLAFSIGMSCLNPLFVQWFSELNLGPLILYDTPAACRSAWQAKIFPVLLEIEACGLTMTTWTQQMFFPFPLVYGDLLERLHLFEDKTYFVWETWGLCDHILYETPEKKLHLTQKEARILAHLMEHGPSSKAHFLSEVWHYPVDLPTHTFESHLYVLRQKLEKFSMAFDVTFIQGTYHLQPRS